MKKIIEEYGQIIVATIGAVTFLASFNFLFVQSSSPFIKCIEFFVKRGM
ncbi:hypothetical protein [Lachnobacterium bovis]|uniref:Uncharacterized protein n=1 Tax=Lachnobacterium bovis TaxID=140626 RepID=A0A1H9RYG2_9FIRM|nr:hypothetical protein [Lachnobacterium bovis]SER77840.1 hypothetical protein SAMN02910429_01046 [Lachnobacterium bovis]